MNIARGLWRWGPVAAIVGLLGWVAVAATMTSVQATKLPPLQVSPRPRVTSTRFSPDENPAASAHADGGALGAIPGWLVTLLLGLVAAGLISIVVAVLWTVVRNTVRVKVRPFSALHPETGAPVRRGEEVLATVQAGIDALDDLGDPRRAVIACWLGLEAAAAEVGTIREAGDTPAELVGRLLADHSVSGAVLAEFVELYRLARYAPHIVDEDMRLRAREALLQLHAELGRVSV